MTALDAECTDRQDAAAVPVITRHTARLTGARRGGVLAVGGAMLVAAGLWWESGRPQRASGPLSLAVLPFKALGAGDEYLADGMTDAITTELGRVAALRVTSANAAFRHPSAATVRNAAETLGVGLVVLGAVQKVEGTTRVEASLIDARTETALWVQRYDSERGDVLTVQNDIARQVAATLARTFDIVVTVPAPAVGTTRPEAHDAYLRGLWHLRDRATPDAIIAVRGGRRLLALRELERAVELDPEFARAHATLASVYTQRIFYDAPDQAQEQRAFLGIQRALTLDSRLAEAYLARAQLTWSFRNDFPHDAAIADLKRAVALNPSLADAYIELGKVYYHIGLLEQAIAANEHALRLDPSEAVPRTRRFRALIDAGRLDILRTELHRNPTVGPYAHADALLALGRPEEALRALAGSLERHAGDPASDTAAVALLGVIQARLRQPANAERTIASAIQAAENPTGFSHMHHAQFHIGAACALLGRRDEAVRWLTKAADEGYPSYPRFSTDQSLTSLRGHEEFDRLLARLEQDWHRWQQRF
jgi:adenylate cyclase